MPPAEGICAPLGTCYSCMIYHMREMECVPAACGRLAWVNMKNDYIRRPSICVLINALGALQFGSP